MKLGQWYEESLFVLPVALHVTQRGGIITRPLLESDGECRPETRYVVHDENRGKEYWATMFNRAISNECGYAGIASLPKFKDDGYYRFHDDAQLVVDSWIKLLRWIRNEAPKLPKLKYKPILSRWNHLRNRKITSDYGEKMKASTIGMPVKRRADLGLFARDMADRRDFL